MKKITVLLAALVVFLGTVLATAPAEAKDITWGKSKAGVSQQKDITWGKTKAYTGKEFNAVLKRKATQTDVTHAADDDGYVADIHVVCTNGTHRYLAPGERTALGSATSSCGIGGVQRIVVGYNQTVYCKNYLPPYQNRYFYTGEYNEVPSFASLKCYMQRPL